MFETNNKKKLLDLFIIFLIVDNKYLFLILQFIHIDELS